MRPYFEREGIQIWHGDCRDVLPTLPLVDVVITDPPYGFRKAAWDTEFPTWWLDACAGIATSAIAVMPGINNVLSLPREVGDFTYAWTLAVMLSNGMTRGLMGFGNWIPTLVYVRNGHSLYRPQQDATVVPVVGDMPDHPSPKPLRVMTWIVSRFEATTILDPFMGSGTTLVAAHMLGRKAVGIEISEAYCEIAARRLSQMVLPLFPSPVDGAMTA
jgi:tRNA G10  N-methylase Trm11